MPRLFLGLAVVLLIVCVATLVSSARFVRGAERTTGTVIDHRSELSDGTYVYHPVVRFATANGQAITFTSSTGSSSPPDIGDDIEVLYDPDNPQDAQLSGFFDIWLWPIVSGGLGIMFAVFGLFAPGFGLLGRPLRRA